MGNHDLWDSPEDIAEERVAEKFQKEVGTVHRKLTAMPADGRFTVDELGRLLDMPSASNQYAVPAYSKENLAWLQELEKKVKGRRILSQD
jgi:hypothetical protein